MTTAALTHQIATQTSYAVYAARKAKEDELHACIKGWGNVETHMSGKIREEVAALLALQIYWQGVAAEMLATQIKAERDAAKATIGRAWDQFQVGDKVRYSRHYGAAGSVRVFGTVTKVNQASYTILTEGEDGHSFTRTIKKANVGIDYRAAKQSA